MSPRWLAGARHLGDASPAPGSRHRRWPAASSTTGTRSGSSLASGSMASSTTTSQPSRRCAWASSSPIGAGADDDEALRRRAVGEHGLVGQVVHAVEPRDRRNRRGRSRGDDEAARPDFLAAGDDRAASVKRPGRGSPVRPAFEALLGIMRRDGSRSPPGRDPARRRNRCAARPRQCRKLRPTLTQWACLAAAIRALDGTQP
jgi:hypothetical protein